MASLPKMAVAPKNSPHSKSSLKPYCERLGARKPFGIHMGILAVKTGDGYEFPNMVGFEYGAFHISFGPRLAVR